MRDGYEPQRVRLDDWVDPQRFEGRLGGHEEAKGDSERPSSSEVSRSGMKHSE